MKALNKRRVISKRAIRASAAQSLKMEGISLRRALKDTATIKKLKQYGRAFSV